MNLFILHPIDFWLLQTMYQTVTQSLTRARINQTASASGIQSSGGPRCFFANAIQDLSVSSAGFCLLLIIIFFFDIFMASCPCHQRNPPCTCWLQLELSGTCVCPCCVHTHTSRHTCTKIYFSSTLLNYTSFSSLARQYSDIQAFQKSDRIHAQLSYFILYSVSSWKLTIDRFTLVFDPTNSVMVFFQMFPSWVAITKKHSPS